jgi:hypothetical protein
MKALENNQYKNSTYRSYYDLNTLGNGEQIWPSIADPILECRANDRRNME